MRYPKGGMYDDFGFYVYKNGSFVDPKGYFFDEDGYDEWGGYYDENNTYRRPGSSRKNAAFGN